MINPEFGSFFFIATILINTELEYDKPVDDMCKSCTLCVNACPTGALYDEYKLDSNLCISYQTIENRNDIPDDIISAAGYSDVTYVRMYALSMKANSLRMTLIFIPAIISLTDLTMKI